MEVMRQQPGVRVQAAFLEWSAPDLPTCTQALIQAGVTHVRILPVFLGIGKHLRDDLPALMKSLQSGHPDVTFELLPSAGESPEVIRCLASLTRTA